MLVHTDDYGVTLRAAAEIMANLRPDIFTVEYATKTIKEWIGYLGESDNGSFTGTGGFVMFRQDDGDYTEGYELFYHITGLCHHKDDGEDSFAGSIWQAQWATTPIEETV